MVQIKLSIAFVLAAAAIAPIAAQPVHESHEFADNVDHQPHHHHNHHHHQHHHQRVANPEQASSERTYDAEKVAREYPENGSLFERADTEEGESRASTLPHFNSPLRFGLGTVPRPNRGHFGHGPVVPRPFNGPGSHGLHFGPGPVVLRPLNRLTPQELRNDLKTVLRPARRRVTAREYPELEEMLERDFEDVEFDAREYPEINDLFERADAEVHHFDDPETIQKLRDRINRPRFGRPRDTIPRPNGGQIGHGPVVHHFDDPETIKKLRDIFNHHRFGGRRVSAREYPESEEMFGRDFEDAELDARDYDDLYLD